MTVGTPPVEHSDAATVQSQWRPSAVVDNKLSDVESQIMVTTSGLRVSPTPSADPDDPLNWPMWWKIAILTQTSLLAAIGGLNTAMINPALLQLSKEFQIDKVNASYQTTVCIALNGIAPWLWIPLAYKFGRRPIYLATTLLGFVTILSCAFTHTYTQLLIARIFNGFFPVGFALGATTVTDLFFFHQRGRAMGFFTVTVVNGSHLAPIFGGLIGQYCGWRWIFNVLAIVDAVLFLVAFFCLPETMYHRPSRTASRRATTISQHEQSRLQAASAPQSSDFTLSERANQVFQPRTKFQTYLYYLRLCSPDPTYKIDYISTVTPVLRLFLAPTAVFPAIYYAAMYGFASILPAVTAAAVFSKFFKWDTLTIGLAYGGALTTGGILGEFLAGWVCDAVVQREQTKLELRSNSADEVKVRPEVRLRPIWPGAVLTPVGLLLYGFTIQYHTHPALPLFGMGLACFGLQIITTCAYTYAIDCHTAKIVALNRNKIMGNTSEASDSTMPSKAHSTDILSRTLSASEEEKDSTSAAVAQVAQLFNFIRQMFGFTFAFYVVRMGDKIGYQWTFVIFAVCGGLLAFAPVVWLIIRGERRIATDKNLAL